MAQAPPRWQNSITGYGEEAPDQLLANPRNWRVHPQYQKDALIGSLNELGWIAPVIVNQTTGHVLDGHARIGEAIARGEAAVPVAYVTLTPEQEALALATLDPIAAMAGADKEQFAALLEDITTGEAGLQALLSSLAADFGVVALDSEWASALGALPEGERDGFQQMTFTLTDVQAGMVRDALRTAKHSLGLDDTGNANSNGNALAAICEAYGG